MLYRTSTYEKIIQFSYIKIKEYKHPLFSTLIIGLLTYLYSFTNKFINHDDVAFMFFHGEVATDHGRWGLDILNLFMPPYSMPWIYGILSIFIISIAICYIIHIFKIENKYFQVLLSGIIISFQSLVGMMSYMFLSYSYSLAFLFSVTAIYFIRKNNLKNYFYALILMVLSMSIYQAYISVTISLFLILLAQDLLVSEIKTKDIIKKGIKYVTFIIISSIVYYTITLTIFTLFDVHFNSYSNERLNSDWGLYPRIYWLIINLISCLTSGTYGFVNTYLSKAIHYILIFSISFFMIYTQIISRNIKRTLLSFLILLLFPFAINCIHIITPTGTHSLTLLSFISIYIFIVIIIQTKFMHNKYKIYDITLILLSLLLINNVLIANKNHLKQYLQYESAHAFYTGVMSQIENTPGFNNNSKIALIGEASNLVYNFSDFKREDITGIWDEPVLNIHSRKNFIKYFIGFDLLYTSETENELIQKTQDFKDMPSYPYYGSIKKIGNNIVVKFN